MGLKKNRRLLKVKYQREGNLKEVAQSPYLSPYPFIASTRAILEPKGCNVDIGKGFASKLVHGLSFSVQKGFLSHYIIKAPSDKSVSFLISQYKCSRHIQRDLTTYFRTYRLRKETCLGRAHDRGRQV